MKKPRTNDHHHTPSEERAIREAALDETIENSFPASDPPSTVPNPDDDEALARKEKRERNEGPDAPKRRQKRSPH
jgi:hypothetical protein